MTFCSVVIPTIGRSSLGRAIASVLGLPPERDDIEVVVVNDSGAPLADTGGPMPAGVRVITTNRRERSVARNAGAAIARGRYLYFLDDDDWMLPDAWEHFRALARRAPDAGWLYGGIRVIDEDGRILGEANSGLEGRVLAQVLGGAWAPLQCSLIRADRFFDVGGFDPFICGTEDLDLCRRMARGNSFANTAATVGCLLRGTTWQTSTDYGRAAEDTRRSRDAVLDEPGALAQVVRSARSAPDSAYWFGRAYRAYASTIPFNLRHRRYAAAMSRALAASALATAAGARVLTPRYWDGVRAHHVPGSLHFIE